ncbi:hypothetical protein WME91_45480 [Sorangium sp. So ce269]
MTRLAARCTSGLAFPIAMLSPESANMRTSFGMSPIVATRSIETPRSFERRRTTVPWFASGLVTSRK